MSPSIHERTNVRLPLRKSGPIAVGGGARRSPCRPRPHELPLRGLLTKHPGRACIPESTETTDKWTNGCTEGQDVGFVSLSIDGWTDERVNDRMTAWC